MPIDTIRLLKYLPSIYQEDPFLGELLLAFEKVLFGPEDQSDYQYQGLEESITNIWKLFDPDETREDFLEWLANWTALSLRSDLTVQQQRDFIKKIVQLYKNRGTKENLQNLLKIFLTGTPDVLEPDVEEMQIGVHSKIGEDTFLGGGPPHFFRVEITMVRSSPDVYKRQLEIAHALIELEKPAHTHYELILNFPTMQIGVYSTLGKDTILGPEKIQERRY